MRIVEIGLWCVENDLFPLQVVENNILWPNVEINYRPSRTPTNQEDPSKNMFSDPLADKKTFPTNIHPGFAHLLPANQRLLQ